MSLADSLSKTNTNTGKANHKAFNNGDSKPGKLGGMMDSAKGINKNVAGTAVGVGNIVAKAAGALGMTKLANFLTGTTKIKYNKKAEDKHLGGLMGFYEQFGGVNTNPT